MNIFELFEKSKPLNQRNAPGLLGSVEQLATQAGTSMPKVRLAKVGFPNAMYHPLSDTLFVTDGILKMTKSSDLKAPASREMNAILAHEMGHVRFKVAHFGPTLAITIGGPLVALATAYLLEKTYDRVKKANKEDHEHPKQFWEEFGHVTREAQQHGWATFRDFAAYMYPLAGKALHADRYKDESWSHTVFDQTKIVAINTAAMIPSYAACRPLALKNEWQSDRYMLALTQDKEACISAFNKLKDYSEKALKQRAHTHVQKNFAQKISHVINNFMQNTIMAHPDLAERIQFLRRANPAELAKTFHL